MINNVQRIVLLIAATIIMNACVVGQVESDSKPISHEKWNQILNTYVDTEGMVDYARLQNDSAELNAYIADLSGHHPNENYWTENERLAFWINAYNAYTLQLIIRHYPIESIKDITAVNIPLVHSPWDIRFIEIEGISYDLNNIEHGIIREQFEVPEIHFTLVCAARSCPRLRREAYVAERLDEQLKDQARQFLNDPTKNRITSNVAELSKLFSWYKGDFTGAMTLREYINQFVDSEVTSSTEIKYLDYDWRLNGQ